MASSAFKSTSKRSYDVVSAPSKTNRTAPPRRGRSRSVARVRNNDDIQFSNKRDNPLFSRQDDVDTAGRRFRSLSRNPRKESDTEQECDSNSVRSTSHDQESHKIWPADNLASVSSRVPNWDDGGSGVYFSEAEEQTINEFTQCILSVDDARDEASRRMYNTDVDDVMRSICDIPNDLDPGPVELVLDIRREYVKELELSEERARKIRADLAAEEHRGLELGRVLKELLPDSRVDSLHKSRLARKNSNERRRTSKRLYDEALAYFDECISISTFDSSDLSSLEDPPTNLQASAPVDNAQSVVRGCSTVRATSKGNTLSSFCEDSRCDGTQNQVDPRRTAGKNIIVQNGPSPTLKSKSYSTSWSRNQENTSYSTDKENEKHGSESQTVDQQVEFDEYNVYSKAESMLFDKVSLKNRIDSGCVFVCEGVALSDYPSFIY